MHDFSTPNRTKRLSEHKPRRSATPKTNIRAINFVDVDKYVGKISELQAGNAGKNTGHKRDKSMAKSFKITPANITDDDLRGYDSETSLRKG